MEAFYRDATKKVACVRLRGYCDGRAFAKFVWTFFHMKVWISVWNENPPNHWPKIKEKCNPEKILYGSKHFETIKVKGKLKKLKKYDN